MNSLGVFLVGAALFGLVLDTAPVPCDEQVHVIEWVNQDRRALHVTYVDLWLGADYGMRGDLGGILLREDAPEVYTTLAYFGWDRYAEPTGPHQQTFNFTPHYILVQPGQRLMLGIACGPSQDKNAHAIAHLWYIWGK